MDEKIVARVSASAGRRWFGIMSLVVLGGLLLSVSLSTPPALIWQLFLLALSLAAFLMALAAAVTGTAEMLMVPGIRWRAPAWTHAILAVLLISLLGLNWGYRLYGYESAVLPYGILISGFNVLIVSFTGWHGGKLVFDYRLGTSKGS